MVDPRASSSTPPVRFQTTCWSILLRAATDSNAARAALEHLCQTYWFPVYSYVRRRGNTQHDAADLTQKFFVNMMEKEFLKRLPTEDMRFRAYLLTALKNFMTGDWRKRTAARRGGLLTTLTLDDAEIQYQKDLSDKCTAETLFERRWVESLLKCALNRLKSEYTHANKTELFDAVHGYLVAGSDQIPQSEIATRLDMSTAAVAMSVHRLRKRYGQIIREEIANTVASPDEVNDELNRLMVILAESR